MLQELHRYKSITTKYEIFVKFTFGMQYLQK